MFGSSKKEPVAPKLYDPIKGTVYGNVLDKFDNYAYNIKLYMIPPVAGASGQEATPVAGANARDNSSGGAASSAQGGPGGYLHNWYVAPPEETVILAQTGVTGAQIDNVQIVSAVGTGGAFFTSTVNFDIIQPGAANFIDQILATKKHIGAPIFAGDVPIFMEITFKGYTDETDDDEGGVATAIAGPYRYKLTIKNVNIEIDEKGSTYAFECVSEDQLPYSDQYYTLPCLMTVTGGTIEEYIKDLEAKIFEYGEKNMTDYQYRDEILFDLSGLLAKAAGGADNDLLIKDDKLTNNSEAKAEDLNRIMNPSLVGKTQEEYKEILEDDPIDSGKLDVVIGADMITFREGMSIETCIATILSMSEEFFAGTTRSEFAEAGTTIDKKASFVKWFKVNADYEYSDYDEYRNTYSKRIMYKPTIYRTDGSTIQQQPGEHQNLSKDENQARFDGMSIFKAYHYTYTGRNDQIINCRIGYQNGIALLVPPAGGATGDFSTTQAGSLSTQAGQDDDLTMQEQATKQKKAAEKENANEFLNGLNNNDLASLGQWAGLSASEITDLVNNQNAGSRDLLSTALSNSSLLQAAQAAQEAGNLNTSSDNQKGANNSTYTDKASGYQYGADIIDSIAMTVDGAMSQNAFKSAITNARKQAKAEKDKTGQSGNLDSGDTAEPQVQQIHLTNPAEAATYDGSTRNSIFGYLMQQHGASDFLVKLDMEVKGDPWYLGKVDDKGYAEPLEPTSSDTDETNGDYAVYSKDENYVMFEMQLPRLYDFDVEDEDNNTGYWTPEGTSYFISGVYRMVTVVNNFSSGLYSTELNLNKLTPIKISMLDKIPPEQE